MAMSDILAKLLQGRAGNPRERLRSANRLGRSRSLSLESLEKRELLTVSLGVTAAPSELTEGAETSGGFVIDLSGLPQWDYAWIEYTILGTADGNDYTLSSNYDPYYESDDTRTIGVAAIDDSTYEGDETITLRASGYWCESAMGGGGNLGPISATITIKDNDLDIPHAHVRAVVAVAEAADVERTIRVQLSHRGRTQ